MTESSFAAIELLIETMGREQAKRIDVLERNLDQRSGSTDARLDGLHDDVRKIEIQTNGRFREVQTEVARIVRKQELQEAEVSAVHELEREAKERDLKVDEARSNFWKWAIGLVASAFFLIAAAILPQIVHL